MALVALMSDFSTSASAEAVKKVVRGGVRLDPVVAPVEAASHPRRVLCRSAYADFSIIATHPQSTAVLPMYRSSSSSSSMSLIRRTTSSLSPAVGGGDGCGGGFRGDRSLSLSTTKSNVAFGEAVGRRRGLGGLASWCLPVRARPTAKYSSCFAPASSTRLYLLKGLVSSVDDIIAREEEEARLSPISLVARIVSNVRSAPTLRDALRAARIGLSDLIDRTKASNGDTENKIRLLKGKRNYANEGSIEGKMANGNVVSPPNLDDLNQPDPPFATAYWVSPPFRMTVIASAFFFFPYLTEFLRTVIDVSPDEYDIINGQFGPGVGVIYGTFTALTLQILYQRQCNIQENSTLEASLLAQVTQNVLSLFRDDPDVAREASQIVADQVRVIAGRSRGAEMLTIMRSDPYARILSLVDRFHKSKDTFPLQEEALIECLRSEIPQLMEARAKRLSDEASELPPTHYLVLSLLTGLSLIGFTTATLTIVGDDGKAPLESRLVFAGLTAVFFLFYNFCIDLNNPFGGVYQIKRSGSATFLLQTRWLIARQSFGSEVRFDSGGLRQLFDAPDMSCNDECVVEPENENKEEEKEKEGDCDNDDGEERREEDSPVASRATLPTLDLINGSSDLAKADIAVGEERKARLEGVIDDDSSVEGASADPSVTLTSSSSSSLSSPPPPADDPVVLYFLGTSGFGSAYTRVTVGAGSMTKESEEMGSNALLESTKVIQTNELRRRKELIEKRSLKFGEVWQNEAFEVDGEEKKKKNVQALVSSNRGE